MNPDDERRLMHVAATFSKLSARGLLTRAECIASLHKRAAELTGTQWGTMLSTQAVWTFRSARQDEADRRFAAERAITRELRRLLPTWPEPDHLIAACRAANHRYGTPLDADEITELLEEEVAVFNRRFRAVQRRISR